MCVLDIELVKLIKKRFSELIHNLRIYMLHLFTASEQVTPQVSSLLELCIASWTAKSLEECMDVVCVTNMTFVSYQLNIFSYFLILRRASSPNIAPSIRSMSYMKMLIPISSTVRRSSMQTPWNIKGSGFVLLIRNSLNNFDVSFSRLSFPCKWIASALKRQRSSLYGCLVFGS